ncbi:MFS transporter [Actinokineospora soli]|uniref:MFS transporter n=1 Tax=Actinokineospora soli TaxID=1048753 RepID=A0ABW2U0W1_9PSEU
MRTSTMSEPATLPREVWVIIAANFVIAVGFGLVAPALPTFARGFDVSVTAASIVISAFAVARLLFAPAAGRLVTTLGERRVYLWGLLIVAVTTGACAFATEYWHLLVLRCVAGTGSTMFTVSGVALLIRLTPPLLRGRASGHWGTSFLLGNVAGPIMGGGLIAISLRAPFLVYAGSLVLAVLIVWVALRGSVLMAPSSGDDAPPPMPLRTALRDSGYRAALASNFATGWAVFGVRTALIPLFITEVMRRDESFAGTALALFAAGNVAMLLVSGRLSDRIGRKPLLIAGLALAGAATAWVGFADSVWEFVVVTIVAGLGTGVYSPSQQAAVADVLGKARSGQVLAAFQMTADVGAILGPIIAGVLADKLSFTAAFGVTGAFLIIAALVWLPARETLPRPTEQPHPTPAEAVATEMPAKPN